MESEETILGFKRSGLLKYATMDHNINDPFLAHLIFNDFNADTEYKRAPNDASRKLISSEEAFAKRISELETHKPIWERKFIENLYERGVSFCKIVSFMDVISRLWTDGFSSRYRSQEIQSIKNSFEDYDNTCGHCAYICNEDKKIKNNITDRFFSEQEVASLLTVNDYMIGEFIDWYGGLFDHIDYLTVDEITIRRGLFIEKEKIKVGSKLKLFEKNYFSSYSFSLSVAERFAQTTNSKTKNGEALLISIPLSECLGRIVAFAPFIKNMSVLQFEFVLAPPIDEKMLFDDEPVDGIFERRFIR